jgi:hypothetical protein
VVKNPLALHLQVLLGQEVGIWEGGIHVCEVLMKQAQDRKSEKQTAVKKQTITALRHMLLH